MDIIEKIVKSWRLEHILLSSYLFSKFHIFRSFRILLLPIGGAFWLLHRTLNSNDNSVSILELILKRVSSVSNKKVEFMLKDAAGVAVCAFVISLIDSSVGLNLKSVQDDFFSLLKKLPFAQRLLAKEFRKHRNDFERSLKGPARNIEDSLRELPFKGRSAEEILTLVRAQTVKENLRGNAGKLSGSVYFKDDAHHDLLNRVFGEYSLANPLHADVWPSVMKFEAEIIAMTASLVKGGNDQVCGTTTSVSN